jgi:hypothetical protein
LSFTFLQTTRTTLSIPGKLRPFDTGNSFLGVL